MTSCSLLITSTSLCSQKSQANGGSLARSTDNLKVPLQQARAFAQSKQAIMTGLPHRSFRVETNPIISYLKRASLLITVRADPGSRGLRMARNVHQALSNQAQEMLMKSRRKQQRFRQR